MIKKYELYTTDMCPKCPAAKEFMGSIELEGENINASTDEGLKKAQEKGISTVPTIIFYDEEGNEAQRAHSVDEMKRIVKENK